MFTLFAKPQQNSLTQDRQLLYSREDNGTKFAFYNDGGCLTAEFTQDGKTEVAASLMGLDTQQINLSNAETQAKISKLIEGASLRRTGFSVDINYGPRGGWGKEVHEHRTHEWCIAVGFNKTESKVIAEGCEAVDHHATNPVKHFNNKEAQGWHFNVNRGRESKSGGDDNDSRIIHAVECLKNALGKAKAGKAESALSTLGRGLHCLQDIFAHTDNFAIRKKIGKFSFYHHLVGKGVNADNTKYIDSDRSPQSTDVDDKRAGFSQRYTFTREITLLYLKKYRAGETFTQQELAAEVTKRLQGLKSNWIGILHGIITIFYNSESKNEEKEIKVEDLSKAGDIPDEYIVAIKSDVSMQSESKKEDTKAESSSCSAPSSSNFSSINSTTTKSIDLKHI